jgi:hypothetical protein
MFIKITWDEVGGRVGINRGRKAPYFTRHFDGFPALIPWFSTGSMVSLIPSFITNHLLGQCADNQSKYSCMNTMPPQAVASANKHHANTCSNLMKNQRSFRTSRMKNCIHGEEQP